MSERLTPEWTQTAAEAYGPSGVRGRLGEVIFHQRLHAEGFNAIDFEEDFDKQTAGIDFLVGTHTVDVKSNYIDGVFYIECDPTGWLFNPKKTGDIIVHFDVTTKNLVWYRRADARSKIRSYERRLLKITKDNFRPDFMSRSWDDLFALLRS